VSTVPPPTAEAQLSFLAKIQRLFAEGDFTATYKFALLISLADLAVELGADDGRNLILSNRQIAERFIGLYWKHATPYGIGTPGTHPGILVQNPGAQAAIVSSIAEFRALTPAATPQVASSDPRFRRLLTIVTQTVSAQPLTYLQNFGGQTDEFIYERSGRGTICLKPGVPFCLRRFQPLVQQLARSHWIDHIKGNRRNHSILGRADDLEEFLFATSRQSLLQLGEGLRRLDGAKCFYCALGMASVDVDHFIPFAQYPRDVANNFVLAHPACNRSKSDMLAAKRHLVRWLARLTESADDLSEIGFRAGMIVDAAVSRSVASWGCSSAATSGAQAWVSPNSFEAIDSKYINLFFT
jgi:5-methylcytosine-specific restriction endonuclease McrA